MCQDCLSRCRFISPKFHYICVSIATLGVSRKHKNTWAGNSSWLFVSVSHWVHVRNTVHISNMGWMRRNKKNSGRVIFDLVTEGIKSKKWASERMVGSCQQNRSHNAIWLSYEGTLPSQLSSRLSNQFNSLYVFFFSRTQILQNRELF